MMMSAANIARRSLQRCAAQAIHSQAALRSKSTKAKPEKSFLDSAYSNLSALRWRIATSLTESLSKEEQKELLDRLDIVDTTAQNQSEETENKATQQQSIAEQVAAARLEEKQKQAAKWEKEKAQLLAKAEEATKARVENELAIQHRRFAFEKWQEQVQAEQERSSSNDDAAVITEEPISMSDHPVLGSAIEDLGYKRVHVTSVKVLQSLPVWKKQRTYRHNRAKKMADDKMKTLHLGMPGVIALHEGKSGQLSVIDGQHRVGMMALLEAKKEQSTKSAAFFDFERILVEVYPEDESLNADGATGDESSHAQEIFLEINKAEPVKLVDLPGTVITAKDRKTINEGAKLLEESYPAMFSASQRCRAPHLNIDNLRDALFKSEAVKRHGLKSPKAMVSWMLEQNERLKQEFTADDSSTKAGSVSKTALQKAIKNDFFLGLDSTWLFA